MIHRTNGGGHAVKNRRISRDGTELMWEPIYFFCPLQWYEGQPSVRPAVTMNGQRGRQRKLF